MFDVSDQEIEGIVTSVMESGFGASAERIESAFLGPSGSACAVVGISGPWDGSVAVGCPLSLARSLAATAFELDLEDVDATTTTDAVGELANMIGGNVKAKLPAECRLSLPVVVDGSEYTVDVPGSNVLRTLAFRINDECLVVTIRERSEGRMRNHGGDAERSVA